MYPRLERNHQDPDEVRSDESSWSTEIRKSTMEFQRARTKRENVHVRVTFPEISVFTNVNFLNVKNVILLGPFRVLFAT